MNRLLNLILLLTSLSLVTVSCDTDEDKDELIDPNTAEWFAGKEFSAITLPGEYGYPDVTWWILSLDGNSGPGYAGHFKLTPYWENEEETQHGIVTSYKTYTGKYSVDFEKQRIYLVFDGYSAQQMWSFGLEDDQNSWPYWNPNRYIEVPTSASSLFKGMHFFSGNIFE